jgi:hypothetical protein
LIAAKWAKQLPCSLGAIKRLFAKTWHPAVAMFGYATVNYRTQNRRTAEQG